MKLCAIDPKELEEKILTRFAENQNDELLEDLSDYVINSQKEIERLNKELEEKEAILGGVQQLEAEIERLNKRNKEIYEGFMATQEELKEYAEENERLHSIIKEVREYIESYLPNYDFDKTNLKKLLQILDKENKND